MQGVYWILTLPQHAFIPYLPPQCCWIRGQLELSESGFLHWQVMVAFSRSVRLKAVRDTFGPFHCELSRSRAADEYVWKENTRVPNTQFEIGKKSIKRNSKRDWDDIRECAERNEFDRIPSDVYIRCYSQLRRIATDSLRPTPIERVVTVHWGPTGTGKSHTAWEHLGLDSYPKDPRSKFWDGYRGQEHVIVDEFRGGIDIGHILRWTDKYPVLVEVKGSSVVLKATKIIFTSNLHPRDWYPNLDEETIAALLRRLNIIHFDIPFRQ